MGGWLADELKYKEEMDSHATHRHEILAVKTVNDFYTVDNPLNIRSLHFDKTYSIQTDETISLLHCFRNVKSVYFGLDFCEPLNSKFLNQMIAVLPKLQSLRFNSGYTNLSWEMLSELQMPNIRYLYARMSKASKPKKIVAPQLEEFICYADDEEKLTPMERLRAVRYPCDFSGMPNLQTVDIRYYGILDYSSFSVLSGLKKLVISDVNLTDLQWLSPNYQLRTLCVWGALETVTGISTQRELEILDLSHNALADIDEVGELHKLRQLDLRFNQISDISSVETLENLEYLNLISDTPLPEGMLRKKGIKTVLLSQADRDMDSINGKINEFSRYAYFAIKSENERDLSGANDFSSRRILAERQKPYEERLKSKIQQAFELSLQSVNPFNFRYYHFGYREEYIRRACEKYPFLKVTPSMEELMKREHSLMLTEVPIRPGLLFAVAEDIVRIYAKVEKGTGKFKQEYDSRYRRPISVSASRAIQNAVNKNLSIMFPGDSLDDYDVSIVYAPLYGKEVDSKVAFSVTYAIWSALNDVPVRDKSVMALRFGTNGKIVQAEITPKQLNAVKLQGFEAVITGGKKNETIEDNGICIVKCKTTVDATQEIFVD